MSYYQNPTSRISFPKLSTSKKNEKAGDLSLSETDLKNAFGADNAREIMKIRALNNPHSQNPSQKQAQPDKLSQAQGSSPKQPQQDKASQSQVFQTETKVETKKEVRQAPPRVLSFKTKPEVPPISFEKKEMPAGWRLRAGELKELENKNYQDFVLFEKKIKSDDSDLHENQILRVILCRDKFTMLCKSNGAGGWVVDEDSATPGIFRIIFGLGPIRKARVNADAFEGEGLKFPYIPTGNQFHESFRRTGNLWIRSYMADVDIFKSPHSGELVAALSKIGKYQVSEYTPGFVTGAMNARALECFFQIIESKEHLNSEETRYFKTLCMHFGLAYPSPMEVSCTPSIEKNYLERKFDEVVSTTRELHQDARRTANAYLFSLSKEERAGNQVFDPSDFALRIARDLVQDSPEHAMQVLDILLEETVFENMELVTPFRQEALERRCEALVEYIKFLDSDMRKLHPEREQILRKQKLVTLQKKREESLTYLIKMMEITQNPKIASCYSAVLSMHCGNAPGSQMFNMQLVETKVQEPRHEGETQIDWAGSLHPTMIQMANEIRVLRNQLHKLKRKYDTMPGALKPGQFPDPTYYQAPGKHPLNRGLSFQSPPSGRGGISLSDLVSGDTGKSGESGKLVKSGEKKVNPAETKSPSGSNNKTAGKT